MTQQLYWCTTTTHEDDWFVVSTSFNEAASLHEHGSGCNEGMTEAELVMEIPEKYHTPHLKPDINLLMVLGGFIVHNEEPRVVKFKDRCYVEGFSQDFGETSNDIIRTEMINAVMENNDTSHAAPILKIAHIINNILCELMDQLEINASIKIHINDVDSEVKVSVDKYLTNIRIKQVDDGFNFELVVKDIVIKTYLDPRHICIVFVSSLFKEAEVNLDKWIEDLSIGV